MKMLLLLLFALAPDGPLGPFAPSSLPSDQLDPFVPIAPPRMVGPGHSAQRLEERYGKGENLSFSYNRRLVYRRYADVGVGACLIDDKCVRVEMRVEYEPEALKILQSFSEGQPWERKSPAAESPIRWAWRHLTATLVVPPPSTRHMVVLRPCFLTVEVVDADKLIGAAWAGYPGEFLNALRPGAPK